MFHQLYCEICQHSEMGIVHGKFLPISVRSQILLSVVTQDRYVKLRVKLDESKSRKAVASKEWRQKQKSQAWLDKERQRCRDYRADMTDEQREHTKVLARERQRRKRARERELAGKSSPASKRKVATRSEAAKAKELRAYKTAKQREYRASMSSSKRRAIRKKDADYHAQKRALDAERKRKAAEKIERARQAKARERAVEPVEKITMLIEKASPQT